MFPRYPHQNKALQLLADNPATMLAWEMGCGKSRVVVDHVVSTRPKWTLIFCPSAVVPVWPREFEKHAPDAPIAVVPLRGAGDKRVSELQAAVDRAAGNVFPLVVVVNYEATRTKSLADQLCRVPWDFAVCDESQRIKSADAQQSKLVKKIAGQAARRLCLTGTAMPQGPLDLFGQYRFLDERVFGPSFFAFKRTYAVMGGARVNGKPVQIIGYRNMDDFKARFDRLAHRVTKEEVLKDLPDRTHSYRLISLPPKALKLYREVYDRLEASVADGTVSAANAAVKVMRLQQITSGHVGAETDDGYSIISVIHDEKGKALSDLLDDLPPSEPVVVFARFTPDMAAIKAAAEKSGRAYREQSGQCREWETWQYEDKGGEVIGVQIQSGGAGIDLTRARQAVYFSQTYSLGDYEQSLARVHRPGQRHDVTYTHLLAESTVDEDIYDALQRRQNVIERIVNGVRLSEGIAV